MHRFRWRVVLSFALFGFLANAALFAYMAFSDYTPLPSGWWPLIVVTCPSNIVASYLFFDFNKHTPEMAFAWLFQALVNTAIYFGIGVVFASLLRSPESKHHDVVP